MIGTPVLPAQSAAPEWGLPAYAAGLARADALLLSRAQKPQPPAWDELRDGESLRPAWSQFAAQLLWQGEAPPADGAATERLVQRAQQRLHQGLTELQQRIRQEGVTHNLMPAPAALPGSAAAASGDGQGASRPWSLELLPMLIEPHEWARISAGVAQRAALLQAMLTDLQGPQTLLHRGLLPGALVYRHPGWLRALQGHQPPGGLHLYVVAFDLARGPDGQWWLMAQRTQGPSGLGYVLHNRLQVSRQFPDAFRDLRVQRIASAYRRLLDTVLAQADRVAQHAGARSPRVVLLTPGPYSETYFEHAALARYLGLSLVQGSDLTVRGDRLYLKTVQGLEAVHGVMRRVDDEWCDPLQLRPDSELGVPGLVQVARAGKVVLANALGSGFLESPALLGFLPGIARALLGEELRLPALASWWCGEAAAWHDVRPHLGDTLLRSTYPQAGRTTQVVEDAESLVHLDPEAWTLQAHLALSRAPVWGADALMPRPAMVRVYAVADGSGGWQVLPGGLTRVAMLDNGSVSMQRGGSSLDTWVMTDGEPDGFSMLAPRLQVDELLARQVPVSSRTAENLFWLGRYTERSEQLLRLARSTLAQLEVVVPAPLAQALSDLAERTGLVAEGVPTLVQAPHVFERSVRAGLADLTGSSGSHSLGYHLAALQRAAMALRHVLSSDHWALAQRVAGDFQVGLATLAGTRDEVPAAASNPARSNDPTKASKQAGPASSESGDRAAPLPSMALVLPAFELLGLQLAALTGMQSDRMNRDHGWRLMAVGRLLERLQGVALRLRLFVQDQDAGTALASSASKTVVLQPLRASDTPSAEDESMRDTALGSAPGVEFLLELQDSLMTFRARYQRQEDLLALVELLVLDSNNPRSLAGVLRRLRTELSKLPGSDAERAAFLAMLPEEGAGLPLHELRGASDAQVAQQLARLCRQLSKQAALLSERISARYFNPEQRQEQRL